MKIEINLKIILVFILFLILNNVDTYIIFLIFVLMHEIAHLVVGVLIGGKPRKMNLNPLGVSLEFYSYGKRNGIYKILFFLAGPLLNLVIALMFLYIGNENYSKIIYTNLAICFFNLIPILPLDGGKILKEILRLFVGIEASNRLALAFSKICLFVISFGYAIMIVEIKNVYLLALLVYLWYLYFIEEKKYSILKKAYRSIKNIIN